MKKYTIELTPYPSEFIIDALTEESAIEQAKLRFNKPVYVTVVTNIIELDPIINYEIEDNDPN